MSSNSAMHHYRLQFVILHKSNKNEHKHKHKSNKTETKTQTQKQQKHKHKQKQKHRHKHKHKHKSNKNEYKHKRNKTTNTKETKPQAQKKHKHKHKSNKNEWSVDRCTVVFKFFWGGYWELWENLGGPLFPCFIAFLWTNISKSFEAVHEVSQPPGPLSPTVCIYGPNEHNKALSNVSFEKHFIRNVL